jgi:hypothetical protein
MMAASTPREATTVLALVRLHLTEHPDDDEVRGYVESLAMLEAIDAPLKRKYSPDQERDERGRFSEGGGGPVAPATAPGDITAVREQAKKIGEEMSGAWARELTVETRSAFDRYQSSTYLQINDALRSGGLAGPSNLLDQSQEDYIDMLAMTRALDDAVTDRDLIVFRAGRLPDGLSVGDTFIDHGFGSTSLLASDLPSDDNVFRIQIPEGSHAASLETILPRGEYEVLLQRGTKFEIQDDGSLLVQGSRFT